MLAIPGRPANRGMLLLGVDRAVVVSGRGGRVDLAWPIARGWHVEAHVLSLTSAQVVARIPPELAAGLLRPSLAELVTERDGWREVLLRQGVFQNGLVQAEGDTLRALVEVLASRHAVRMQLWDLERVAALAADLRRGVRPWPVEGTGARRTTFEIRTALRRLGFVHPHGRPVPGDRVAGRDRVLAAVRAALDANPHCAGLTISDDHLAREVDRAYCGVAPWPFAALTT